MRAFVHSIYWGFIFKLYLLMYHKELISYIFWTPIKYSRLSSLFTAFYITLLLKDYTLSALAFLFLSHGKLAGEQLVPGTLFHQIYVEPVPLHLWANLKSPSKRSLLWSTPSPATLYHITMFIFIFFAALSNHMKYFSLFVFIICLPELLTWTQV